MSNCRADQGKGMVQFFIRTVSTVMSTVIMVISTVITVTVTVQLQDIYIYIY